MKKYALSGFPSNPCSVWEGASKILKNVRSPDALLTSVQGGREHLNFDAWGTKHKVVHMLRKKTTIWFPVRSKKFIEKHSDTCAKRVLIHRNYSV